MNKDDVTDILHQIIDMWAEETDIEHLSDGLYKINAMIRVDGEDLTISKVEIS